MVKYIQYCIYSIGQGRPVGAGLHFSFANLSLHRVNTRCSHSQPSRLGALGTEKFLPQPGDEPQDWQTSALLNPCSTAPVIYVLVEN